MKIIIILIYIILFILLIYFSINIEKYTNIEIKKLHDVNIYGNLTIKTTLNNFNIKELCIKNQCISKDKLINLPYEQGPQGECSEDQCKKVCMCNNGTVAEGEDCDVHNKEICINCNENYYFDSETNLCVACEVGTFINNDNHNRKVCCSNTEKYDNNTCLKKTCQCENGEADNENCEDEELTKCKNCNSNYYLNNYECLPCDDEKYTQSGNIDRKCCPKGQHYDFITHACLTNICTCNGGYPTEGEDCQIHGSEDCSSCKGGISGVYYYYSPSAIEGNKCITCNPEGTLSVNMRKMYSDNHRITMCCNRSKKYNENSGKCEYIGPNPDDLCRDGEIFDWEGGYCKCPRDGEIYSLSDNKCEEQ